MTPTALLRELLAYARYTGGGDAEVYADAELVMALNLMATEALAIEPGHKTVWPDHVRAAIERGDVPPGGLVLLDRVELPSSMPVGPDYARANEALALACACLRVRRRGERFLPADVAKRIEALCGEDGT